MKTRYEDSLFYQINLSAKCFNILFDNFFKELNTGISATEHLALSVIIETPNCCQRDLAKIILKDRANTGKLANSLEKKGLIKIEQKTKNNRMVKILTATKKGEEICTKAKEIMIPIADKIYQQVSKETLDDMIENLSNFRKIVHNIMKVNI